MAILQEMWSFWKARKGLKMRIYFPRHLDEWLIVLGLLAISAGVLFVSFAVRAG